MIAKSGGTGFRKRSCSNKEHDPEKWTRFSERVMLQENVRDTHRFTQTDSVLSRLARQPRGIVGQERRQRFLALSHAPALAFGVILDLIAVDAADAEIGALGMGEIKSRHRSARPHGEAFGE